MASSGWQNEQTWFTYSSHVGLIGNINIQSISHSGSSLRVQGEIACGARGGAGYGFYYSDYTSYAQPEGGNKIALGNQGYFWKVGQNDIHVNFDITLNDVPAEQTSRSFYVNFYGPNTNSVKATLYWTLYFDAGGSPPSNISWTYLDVSWNRVYAYAHIGNWNGNPGYSAVRLFNANKTGHLEAQFNGVSDIGAGFPEGAVAVGDPVVIKGCGTYWLDVYAQNSVGGTNTDDVDMYTSPAPSIVTVTDPGGSGSKTYTVSVVGDQVNNLSNYNRDWLKRTIRYRIGSSEWTYVVNDAVKPLDETTTFTITLAEQQDAVVESWMTYLSSKSVTKTNTISNGNFASRLYGSVNGESKRMTKVYASVNGQSKRLVKVYGSVNGQSKKIVG